jgi:hypothetical protein
MLPFFEDRALPPSALVWFSQRLLKWVKLRNTQHEQMSSALTPRTDIGLVARKHCADRVLWNFSEEAARHKRLHIFEVRLRFREPGLILFRRAALCVLAQLHTAQSKLAMASIDGDEHLVIQHRSVPAHL